MQLAQKTGLGLALLAGLGMTAARPVAAQITTYSSQATLNGAATVSGPYSFDAYVAPDYDSFRGASFAFSPTGPGGTPSVTFTDPNALLYLNGTGLIEGDGYYTNAFNATSINSDFSSPNSINISVPNATAFGIQFAILGDHASDTGSVTITVFDVANPLGINAGTFTATAAISSTPASFFGFTDTSEITGIAFTAPNRSVALSNFSYGQAVPEPSSVGSMGLGGVGLLGLLLRGRRHHTAA